MQRTQHAQTRPHSPGGVPVTHGRIRRGPMAADQFTQIRNALFRDARLSAKAKGIFGFISTHRDGWGVTPESIAASMTDGVSAIRTGLRELETFGYLVRDQPRRPDGTKGAIEYYITDQPSSEPVVENRPPVVTSDDAQTRRSEPVTDFPHAAEPHAADHLHKKINSKHTSLEEDSLSSRPSAPAAPAPPAAPKNEREISAAPQNDTDTTASPVAAVAAAWAAARGGHRNPAAETAVATSARLLLAAGWPHADVTALAQDMGRRQPTYRDLTRHADHWRPLVPAAAGPAATPAADMAPLHCGDLDCDPVTRFRSAENSQGFRVALPCPECHPQTTQPQKAGAHS